MDKLIPWSERIKGARDMLVMLNRRMYLNTAHTPKLSKAEKIMHSAVVQLMLDDKTNIDRFLNEDEIVFYDWERIRKVNRLNVKQDSDDLNPQDKESVEA